MMKSASVLAATAAAALLALAGQANAAPALGTFAGTVSNAKLTGSLNLQQTTNIDCFTNLTANVTGTTTGNVTGGTFGAPGDWVCGVFVGPSGFNWTLQPWHDAVTGQDYVKVIGISATSIAGSCSGDVMGEWSDANKTITFNGATIPGSPSTCVFTGTLTSDKAIIVNP
jgi:hypothetical protein